VLLTTKSTRFILGRSAIKNIARIQRRPNITEEFGSKKASVRKGKWRPRRKMTEGMRLLTASHRPSRHLLQQGAPGAWMRGMEDLVFGVRTAASPHESVKVFMRGEIYAKRWMQRQGGVLVCKPWADLFDSQHPWLPAGPSAISRRSPDGV
jgi:hypothetical protein